MEPPHGRTAVKFKVVAINSWTKPTRWQLLRRYRWWKLRRAVEQTQKEFSQEELDILNEISDALEYEI